MNLFLMGLFLFFAIHVITVTPILHRTLGERFPASVWRGVVALVSLAGVVLICLGWSQASNAPLFAPSPQVIRWAPTLVPIALTLMIIGGVGFKGHIRRALHHPMLIGAALWSAVHLLANGGVRETLLFGCFLAFSLYALGTVFYAGKRARFVPALKWDMAGVALGLFIAIGILHSHQMLFGVAVP
jgi:uncharacterized membrane protein